MRDFPHEVKRGRQSSEDFSHVLSELALDKSSAMIICDLQEKLDIYNDDQHAFSSYTQHSSHMHVVHFGRAATLLFHDEVAVLEGCQHPIHSVVMTTLG